MTLSNVCHQLNSHVQPKHTNVGKQNKFEQEYDLDTYFHRTGKYQKEDNYKVSEAFPHNTELQIVVNNLSSMPSSKIDTIYT